MPTQRIGDTVVKTYADELRWQWGREVAFLRKIHWHGYCLQHFPTVVSVGDHSLTTEWVGPSVATVDVPIAKIQHDLEVIQDLLRVALIHHRDITQHNLLWSEKHECVVLIDFGWSRWFWEPDAPMPLPHVMHGLYKPDAEQAEALLRELEEMRK